MSERLGNTRNHFGCRVFALVASFQTLNFQILQFRIFVLLPVPTFFNINVSIDFGVFFEAHGKFISQMAQSASMDGLFSESTHQNESRGTGLVPKKTVRTPSQNPRVLPLAEVLHRPTYSLGRTVDLELPPQK